MILEATLFASPIVHKKVPYLTLFRNLYEYLILGVVCMSFSWATFFLQQVVKVFTSLLFISLSWFLFSPTFWTWLLTRFSFWRNFSLQFSFERNREKTAISLTFTETNENCFRLGTNGRKNALWSYQDRSDFYFDSKFSLIWRKFSKWDNFRQNCDENLVPLFENLVPFTGGLEIFGQLGTSKLSEYSNVVRIFPVQPLCSTILL